MVYKNLILIFVIFIILPLAIIPKIVQAAPNEGTLIKGLSEKVYVIENGLKRWIRTADIFNKLGYSWTNIKPVSEKPLSNIPSGQDITRSYRYPDGTLLKGNNSPVYLIERGLRRWIPNPQVFIANGFKWQNIIQISDKILNRMKKDKDVSLNHNNPNHRPQTFILDGPCKERQTSIPKIEATQIEFKYSGRNNQGNATDLGFETFLVGYDKGWKSSWRSYTRKITLPAGNKTYTFYVQAKTEDGYYDISPAFCKFSTNLSPHHGQVEISSVQSRSTNPAKERIVLKLNRKSSKSINITGWKITTKTSKVLTVPQALKIVHPESMYRLQKDLILEPGETVSIYGGASPIGINAYKTNGCEKYFSNQAEYKNCFYEYNQYLDFYKNEWRIYLNRNSEFLARRNDEIILKDESGLVIDRYSY